MPSERYLTPFIAKDLSKKMVFMAGPRQVGKTTLAKAFLKKHHSEAYFLWDNREDRQKLLKGQWPPNVDLVVLDEIHKYIKWKQWIKGEYDKKGSRFRFLVTGSARLDVYRKGGDSLQGRYHHYRLHPFSVAELEGQLPRIKPFTPLTFTNIPNPDPLKNLFQFGGFPEPLFAQSETEHRRWQKERLERFFREDVRDMEALRDLSSIQLLADILPSRVGKPLSLNSLREDLQVSHRAISHWMDILERLYFVFRIRPYTTRRIQGLKKEPKAYLWDWSLVEDPGSRFENLVASHLLKFCHFLEDTEGYKIELCYLRDVNKREVDFLVTVGHKPWFVVEAKLSEENLHPNLNYFGERIACPLRYQVVYNTDKEYIEGSSHLIPAAKFLGGLV
ncbi:MAG: ATP-binding protein [Deltaproteobacteria bacterium]|nr:ATP-binding protein [Deltaproteobacteria bacterium]